MTADPYATAAVATDTEEVATYVFAVCRDSGSPQAEPCPPGHRGGGDVRFLPVDELVAVVQDVPAHEFSEETLTERLADRGRLETYARAHHGVVAAAARHAATVPLPLATIYRGDERARAAVRESAGRFRTALDRVGGRVEWGVKVYAASDAPPGPAAGATPAAASGEAPPADRREAGRAYLNRVRGRNQQRERRQEEAHLAADSTHRALSDLSVAARRLRAHSPEVSGEQRPQVLNAAYLVDGRSDGVVPAAVERLRAQPWAQHARIEVTGPWVPYSFADIGGADDER